MSEVNEDVLLELLPPPTKTRIEWDAYALKYDAVCQYNPAYQENIQTLIRYVDSWNLPSNASVADLGAGTGNFICALSSVLPHAKFTHVDCSPEMNHLAQKKYLDLGLDNVHIEKNYLQRMQTPDNTYDLIICVNALYAISPQDLFLRKVNRWLKPGGKFFIIDFGRQVRLLDWGWYLMRHTVARYGFSHFTKTLWDNLDFVRQNKKAQRDFSNGVFWEHSTDEFEELLIASGLNVELVDTCYRDYCDLAICTSG